MPSLFDLQMYIFELSQQQDFKDFYMPILGEELSVYVDPNEYTRVNTRTNLFIHKMDKEIVETEENNEFNLQFIIDAVLSDDIVNKPEVLGNLTYYPTIRDIEKVADKLMQMIKENTALLGDCSIMLSKYNILVSDIGESNDIQVIATMQLIQEKYI